MLTIHNRDPAACGIPPACSTEAADLSAFGSMLAYPRGPGAVAEYISHHAGTDPAMIMFLLVVLFVIVGDFIDAVPAIIFFMPIITKLTKVGDINPVHMGVVIITTLVFGLITPPYGLSLLVASKFVGVCRSTARCSDRSRCTSSSSVPSRSRCCSPTWCCGCRNGCCRNRSAVFPTPAAPGSSARNSRSAARAVRTARVNEREEDCDE
jgi:hypothetical protein